MSHDFVTQHMEAALQGDLSPEDKTTFDAHLESCEACREAFRAGQEMQGLAMRWRDQKPGPWNRHAHLFPQRKAQSSWGRIVLIAACMTLAVTSIFQMRVSWGEDGVTLSFGGQSGPDKEKIETILDDAFQAFENQQALKWEDQKIELASMIDQGKQETLLAVMDSNRAERREDLKLVFDQWNTQREHDLKVFRAEFKNIYKGQSLNRDNLMALASYVDKQPK